MNGGEEQLPFPRLQRQEQPQFHESPDWLYGLIERPPLLVEAAQVCFQCAGQVVTRTLLGRTSPDDAVIGCDCVPLAVSATDEGAHGESREPRMEALALSDGSRFAGYKPHDPTYTTPSRPKTDSVGLRSRGERHRRGSVAYEATRERGRDRQVGVQLHPADAAHAEGKVAAADCRAPREGVKA